MSHQLVSRSKILCVVSQELYKCCHFNICSGVHKKCKIQVSTIYPNATLCIKRCTPFMEIDDKGGEIETKIWQLGFWTWTMDKEGATLRELRRIKILRQKRSTQVGGASSWTLIGCIWYVHIHVLASIAWAFKFDMHACVVYGSCRTWMITW